MVRRDQLVKDFRCVAEDTLVRILNYGKDSIYEWRYFGMALKLWVNMFFASDVCIGDEEIYDIPTFSDIRKFYESDIVNVLNKLAPERDLERVDILRLGDVFKVMSLKPSSEDFNWNDMIECFRYKCRNLILLNSGHVPKYGTAFMLIWFDWLLRKIRITDCDDVCIMNFLHSSDGNISSSDIVYVGELLEYVEVNTDDILSLVTTRSISGSFESFSDGVLTVPEVSSNTVKNKVPSTTDLRFVSGYIQRNGYSIESFCDSLLRFSETMARRDT